MELGQKVKFNKKYTREHNTVGDNGFERIWKEKEIKETEGVFVGLRNLVNSYLKDYEDFSEFDYHPNDIENKVEGQCALIAVSKAQLIKVPKDSVLPINV